MPAKAEKNSRLVIILLVMLMAMGPISTDLYLPSLPSIGRTLGATQAEVQLTLSVFLVGFAASQLIYGPLSDRFGRRPVFIGGVIFYLLATLVCSYVTTIEGLIAARFVQSLGASAGPVLSRTVVRDVYGHREAARVMSWMGMAMALAPAVGPMIGGYVQVLFGWQANFLLLSGFSILALLGLLLILPETNEHPSPDAMKPARLVGNYAQLLSHRLYLGYVLVAAGSFATIFCFISGSSFVLIDTVGLSPDAFGLCFASIVAGYMTGTFCSGKLTDRLGPNRLILLGTTITMIGGFAALLLALTAPPSIATVVPPFILVTIGCGLTMPNNQAAALAPFPRMAGAASALMGFVMMTFGAGVGVMISNYSDGTALSMTVALAAVSILAFLSYVFLVHPLRHQPVAEVE